MHTIASTKDDLTLSILRAPLFNTITHSAAEKKAENIIRIAQYLIMDCMGHPPSTSAEQTQLEKDTVDFFASSRYGVNQSSINLVTLYHRLLAATRNGADKLAVINSKFDRVKYQRDMSAKIEALDLYVLTPTLLASNSSAQGTVSTRPTTGQNVGKP